MALKCQPIEKGNLHKTPREGVRDWDDPDLAWKDKHTEFRVFALGEDEAIEMKTSTNYDHCFGGPGIVLVEMGYGHRIHERYVHDRTFWHWIGRLMRDGLGKYGGKLLTPTDDEE